MYIQQYLYINAPVGKKNKYATCQLVRQKHTQTLSVVFLGSARWTNTKIISRCESTIGNTVPWHHYHNLSLFNCLNLSILSKVTLVLVRVFPAREWLFPVIRCASDRDDCGDGKQWRNYRRNCPRMYQLKKYEEITFNIIQLLEVQLDGCSLVSYCGKEWWSNSKDGCILIWMHAFKPDFTEGVLVSMWLCSGSI